MGKELLYAAILAVLCAQEVYSQFMCVGLDDGLYADPANCTKFYHCKEGRAVNRPGNTRRYDFDCEHKKPAVFFSRKDSTCEHPANLHIDYECNQKTGKRYPIGSKSFEIDFQCPDDTFKFYPHPTDCLFFYQCRSGKASLSTCSGGNFFQKDDTLPTGGKCKKFTDTSGCDMIGRVVDGSATPEPATEAPGKASTDSADKDADSAADSTAEPAATTAKADATTKSGSNQVSITHAVFLLLLAPFMC